MRHCSGQMDRRDFVRSAAGVALLPLARPQGLWLPRRVPPRSRVALVRTTDRRRGVSDVLRLFAPPGIDGKPIPAFVAGAS